MNLAYNRYQENLRDLENEAEAAGDKGRDDQPRAKKVRRNSYAQRSRPVVHSGIHRRRNKRFGA